MNANFYHVSSNLMLIKCESGKKRKNNSVLPFVFLVIISKNREITDLYDLSVFVPRLLKIINILCLEPKANIFRKSQK